VTIQSRPKVRAAVFGTFGFENMGDAAVADATIDGLRRNIPDTEIVAICQQPENVALRHGVEAYSIFREFIKNSESLYIEPESLPQLESRVESGGVPIGHKIVGSIKSVPFLYVMARTARNLVRGLATAGQELVFSVSVFRIVRNLDLMVMSGSGQLNEEWGGPWRYPFGLFRWCLLARISGCKIAFLSVGAGETEKFWTRFFCANALRLAHYKSVRDLETRSRVESWGVKQVLLVPDMAFSMRFEIENSPTSDSAEIAVVGINPIAFCDPRTWNIPDPDKYSNFVAKLAEFCDWLLTQGYSLCFVPNELLMDNLTIDDILAGMKHRSENNARILRPETLDYTDVFRHLASCDFMLACRFHGLVFSFMSHIPSITLAHHYKFLRLAEEMGQGRYGLDIETFQLANLKELFMHLVENRVSVTKKIAENSAKYSELVEAQYQKLGKLLSCR
jgi:polysaccharide pyruvyl transferase WcaK-like protein